MPYRFPSAMLRGIAAPMYKVLALSLAFLTIPSREYPGDSKCYSTSYSNSPVSNSAGGG